MTSQRKEGTGTEAAPTPMPAVSNAKVDDLRGFETMHGLIVGTPPYISPEQARGELDRIDERSDIYVLGGILYAILALRPPVEGESVHEVVEKIVTSAIAPPSTFNQPTRKSSAPKPASADGQTPETAGSLVFAHCPGKRIPDGLSAVVMKALALDPGDRYQNVEDLQADVEAYQGGFATKAERATMMKHAMLFTGRHKKEVAVFAFFAVLFFCALGGFLFQVMHERDRARLSEKRAIDEENRAISQEKLAAARLDELRGTAPTFAEESRQLIDDGDFTQALEKIDYAIQQVPNDGGYHDVRGNILQAQLRLEEAADAYDEALRINPKLTEAKLNLDLTRRILKQAGTDEQIKPAVLSELYASLVNQGRKSAAENIRGQLGPDQQKIVRIWRDALDKHGMRQQHFETNPDGTINVDFSNVGQPDLKRLRDVPVKGLILDETKLVELNGLKGLQLQSLSLVHSLVRDFAPLVGMPLHNLNLEGSAITDLTPLTDLPLEVLHLNNTRVSNLNPLADTKIEQLFLGNCRNVKDLSPLNGLPLQTLTLNRTGVSDLRPLTHSPLRELNLEGCSAITDLHPLMEITTLESVQIPLQIKDISFLRHHPGIKRLSYVKMTEPAEEFWKVYDARQARITPKPPAEEAPAKSEGKATPAASGKPAASEKAAATPASEETAPRPAK
jgi:tetratricopeptide (TPR) repeat protein